MNIADDPTPEEEAAARGRYEDSVRRGAQIRRRRLATRAVISTALVAISIALIVPALQHGSKTRTSLDVTGSKVSTTSHPTSTVASNGKAPPDEGGLAAGVCATAPAGDVVRVVIPGDDLVPQPRCGHALSTQSLVVANHFGRAVVVQLAQYSVTVDPGADAAIGPALGSFLQPGVHNVSVTGTPAGSSFALVVDPT